VIGESVELVSSVREVNYCVSGERVGVD